MMHPKTSVILLLAVDVGVAFVSNMPPVGLLGVKNARTATTSTPRIRCRVDASGGRRGLQPLRVSSADADADGTPSWRFELDDLLKAASPWGSVVETEIIAMDLLKVKYYSY